VTFKDLKKRVSLEATTQQQLRLNERLQNKPFWIWDKQQHKLEDVRTDGNCCFNYIIGLPQKDGNDKPLYDYEEIIFDSLVTHNGNKHIWINKETGLGESEFMLRYMAWLCLKDNALSGSQMCIHHLDAMRGLPNVSFILLDEADFFPLGQQQDARSVSERYIAKSNPYIVMVSTPNAPDGLFERIEKESEDICLYKRIFLDYTYGIGKIYIFNIHFSLPHG
jgi:hypothetical protein